MTAPARFMPAAGARKFAGLAAIAAVALAAVLERLPHLGNWPSGYRMTIEFDSADAARTIWISLTGQHGTWQQAWMDNHVGRFIEPPVIQTLTALTYLPDGVERPWTSQLFGIAFWFAAAAILFVTMRRRSDRWGAALSAGYLLLAPFAVIVSANFQVEPIMVFTFALLLWYAGRGDVTQGRRFVIAAVLGMVAGLVKPGALLPFVVAIYFVSAFEDASPTSFRDRRRWARLVALIAIAALPAFAYAFLIIPSQVGDKVLPQLLWDPSFYVGWARMIYKVVGIVPLVGAVAGFILAPRMRLLGLALGACYLGYSAIFTWHTMTHEYYQVPLMVIVAIGLGGLGEWLAAALQRVARSRALAVAGGFAIAVALTFVVVPRGQTGETPGRFPDQDRFAAIGQTVGPGSWVVAYTPNYGRPLEYYGRILTDVWPTPADEDYQAEIGWQPETIQQRLTAFIELNHPRYFVLTELSSDTQSLVTFLDTGYPLVQSGPNLRIYDLTKPLKSGLPGSGG